MSAFVTVTETIFAVVIRRQSVEHNVVNGPILYYAITPTKFHVVSSAICHARDSR
jgi:hypothetical protein